jgi:Protein of unknown function DUF262
MRVLFGSGGMGRIQKNLFQNLDLKEVQKVIDDSRSEVRYLITDFPAELLASKFRENPEDEGDIYVPLYQRTLQWTPDKKSYFIESLILRIPVPPIFFCDQNGRLEIIDGSQRTRTLVSFLKDEFQLAGLETLDILNGFSFSQLPTPTQKRLNNTPIRSFILDQSTDESTRIEVFRRINTSGKKLADAEVRKGAYRGPFLDLVLESANLSMFKKLCPGTKPGVDIVGRDPISERQELATRFFVYSDHYLEFVHDVRKFLDQKMVSLNLLTPAKLEKMKREFIQTMSFIDNNCPDAFRRTPSTHQVPRVRFEAVAVGFLLALRKNPNLKGHKFEWLRGKEFLDLVRTDASNSGPRLRGRIEYVRDKLLRI